MAAAAIEVQAGDRAVRVSSPDRILWPQAGITKGDLARYWADLGEVGLRGYRSRPVHLHRFPKGIDADGFFQKRIPSQRPDWIHRAHIVGPNGTSSDALCPTDVAHLVWGAQMGTIEFHPWPTRSWEPEHPDELRIDLDPSPGTGFDEARQAAGLTREVLTEVGLTGWPKTSGKRGIHVLVRITPSWDFVQVRAAAVALARELERRAQAGDSGLVEGGTRRAGIRRLQPELSRPHVVRRLVAATNTYRHRVCAVPLGRPRPRRTRRRHGRQRSSPPRLHRRRPRGYR